MYIRYFVGLIFIYLLAGCSDIKETPVVQNQDLPTYVRNANLPDYWEVQNMIFSLDLSDASLPKRSGQVEVGFIIDSNGQTSSFEIVKSMPKGLWDRQAMKGAKQLAFVRAATNTYTDDIYTTWQFEFKADLSQ